MYFEALALLALAQAGPTPGSVAPALGVPTWTVAREDQDQKQGEESPTLADLARSVVIVHSLAWGDRAAPDEVSPVVMDLVRAGADRGLTAITLVAEEEGSEPRKKAERRGIEHLVATVAPGASPYFHGAPYLDGAQAFVIGRTGEVAWRGDPIGDQKEFLESVTAALLTYPAKPLERDLAAELRPALELYFTGEWARARKSALKLEKRFRKKDPEIAADARYLAETIDEFERECVLGFSKLSSRQSEIEFWQLLFAVRQGFPKSEAVEVGEAVVADRRRGLGASTILEARAFVELEAERPLFFPARESGAGKRFARKLEGLLKGSSNQTRVQKRARELLQRYGMAD